MPDPVPVRWLIGDAKGNVYVQAHRRWNGSFLYVVKCGDYWLNRDGEWKWAMSPSERSADFLARCRFATLEEAVACYWEHHDGERGADHVG